MISAMGNPNLTFDEPRSTAKWDFFVNPDYNGLLIEYGGRVVCWILHLEHHNDGEPWSGNAYVSITDDAGAPARRVGVVVSGSTAYFVGTQLRLHMVSTENPEINSFRGTVTALYPADDFWSPTDGGLEASGTLGVQTSYWLKLPPDPYSDGLAHPYFGGTAFSIDTVEKCTLHVENMSQDQHVEPTSPANQTDPGKRDRIAGLFVAAQTRSESYGRNIALQIIAGNAADGNIGLDIISGSLSLQGVELFVEQGQLTVMQGGQKFRVKLEPAESQR